MLQFSNNILDFLKGSWSVLVLFLIPVGGGIPAGVLTAKNLGIIWPATAMLYFISDVILAAVLEPLVRILLKFGKRNLFFVRLTQAFNQSLQKTVSHYGGALRPLTLILIAFGVDPMTGRAVAASAGHGFVSGWALAITGDMFYFALIMSSTLWLNSFLGDGTWTTAVILGLMLGLPPLVRRIRRAFSKSASGVKNS